MKLRLTLLERAARGQVMSRRDIDIQINAQKVWLIPAILALLPPHLSAIVNSLRWAHRPVSGISGSLMQRFIAYSFLFLLLFVAFVTPAHILNEEFAQTPPSPISGEELAAAAADESG